MRRPRRGAPRAWALLAAGAAAPAAAQTTTLTEALCVDRLADGTIDSGAAPWTDGSDLQGGGNPCSVYANRESKGDSWCMTYALMDWGHGTVSDHCCVCGGGCPSFGCPTTTLTTATSKTTTTCIGTCKIEQGWNSYVDLVSSARPGHPWCGRHCAALALLAAAGSLLPRR